MDEVNNNFTQDQLANILEKIVIADLKCYQKYIEGVVKLKSKKCFIIYFFLYLN